MKRINHEARLGGPTMAAVSVTRLTQHAPVFRLELLLFSCSPTPPGTSPVGGYLPLAPGVSTVRYPIPQRTFKYVATVQSVTDETCQELTFTRTPPDRRSRP